MASYTYWFNSESTSSEYKQRTRKCYNYLNYSSLDKCFKNILFTLLKLQTLNMLFLGNRFYRFGIRDGVLKQLYVISQFTV